MGSAQRQTSSGLMGWTGWFRKKWSRSTWRLLWVVDDAFALISRSYGVVWGGGRVQGQWIWVVVGWRRGWGRRVWAGAALALVQLLRLYWDGGFDRIGGLRPQIGMEWEWFGFVVVEAQRFGSFMVLPAIWYYDRVAVARQLLVIEVLLVLIDAEEWFEVRIGGSMAIWLLLCCVGRTLVMLNVAACGSRGFNYGVDMAVTAVECLPLILDLSVFQFCIFQLFVVFGSIFRSQISPGSFESGLLSEIWVGVWSWVVGPSLGPNLLTASSCTFDYQPVLMNLTLMSISNARTDYLKGMSDQLCCLLVF